MKAKCFQRHMKETKLLRLALRFYQKRGFRLVTVHRYAVDAARQLKPRITLIGNDQIPYT